MKWWLIENGTLFGLMFLLWVAVGVHLSEPRVIAISGVMVLLRIHARFFGD